MEIIHHLVHNLQHQNMVESKTNTEAEAKLIHYGNCFDSHLRRFEGGEWHRTHVPGYTENVVPFLMAHGMSYDQAKQQASRPYDQSWQRVYDANTSEVRLGVLQCTTDRGRRVSIYDTTDHGWTEMCPAGSVLYACNASEKEFGRRRLRRMTRWEGKSVSDYDGNRKSSSGKNYGRGDGDYLFGQGRSTQSTSTIAPKGGTELTERFLRFLPHVCPYEEVMFVKRTYVDNLGTSHRCNEVFRRGRDEGTLIGPLERINIGSKDDVVYVRTILYIHPKISDHYVVNLDGSVEGNPVLRGLLAVIAASLGDEEVVKRCFGFDDDVLKKCIFPTEEDVLLIDADAEEFVESVGLSHVLDAKQAISSILTVVQRHIRNLIQKNSSE